MKISKRAREDAIEELLACADTWITNNKYPRGRVDFAMELAAQAEMAVEHLFSDERADRVFVPGCPFYTLVDCLEAAALLRDGWNPGDPVELL